MESKSSYPDPEVAHGGMHPFSYAAPPLMPPTEHARAHMQQAPAANMRGSVGEEQEYGQSNHNGQPFVQNGQLPREAQPSTPQQLAQRGLDADQSQERGNADPSARKRAKVTRACDECRRKKVYRLQPAVGQSSTSHELITDVFRYDAMPSQRPPVYSAVPANEQIRCAISEERHKSEDQAKGVWIPGYAGLQAYTNTFVGTSRS